MTTTAKPQEGCMSVTAKLLSVFRVDQQIQGLQSRLEGAERFLAEQTRQLAALGTEKDSIDTQLRQLRASEANAEGESKRIETHIDELREKMNNAATNKEYKALLSEVNNLKEVRSTHDDQAIEFLEQIEVLNTKLETISTAVADKEKVRALAEEQRQQRSDEIAEKLAELKAQREELVTDVPKDAMAIYAELLEMRGEDAMAPLEVADRKRHEYVCGSSMMSVPVEVAASLMQGKLTLSPNDGCILYLTPEVQEELSVAFKK
jgi:uncharacterized protein